MIFLCDPYVQLFQLLPLEFYCSDLIMISFQVNSLRPVDLIA
jgi:hypothetical protein